MIADQTSNVLSFYLKENNINRLLLAISGGVDSIVLLDILYSLKKKYNLNITLMHINYNMQNQSQEGEKLCYSLAAEYNLKILSKSVKISNNNFESNARKIRYNLFNKYSKKNNIDYILTAHHMDDQIETLYMKSQENSDWISYLGIREKYGKIIRPMLKISKDDIYAYAENKQLQWIEDLSNKDIRYKRNNIRINVIPKMIEDNASDIKKLFKKHYKAIDKFKILKKRIKSFQSDYIKSANDKYVVLLNRSINIDDVVEFKIFYQDLCQKYLDSSVYCTKKHWLKLHSFLSASNTGSSFILDEHINISKDKKIHYLYLKKILSINKIKLSKRTLRWYQGYFSINKRIKTDSLLIDSIKIPEKIYTSGVYIRNWHYGDKFYLKDKNTYCSVNKIFKKNKMSVFDKKTYPILTDSENNILYMPKIYNGINSDNDKFIILNWCKRR